MPQPKMRKSKRGLSDMDKLDLSLSPKQLAYANTMAGKPGTRVSAYREVYDDHISRPHIQRMNSGRLATDSVVLAAADRVASYQRAELQSPAESKAWLLSRFRDIAQGDATPVTIKALELLGKLPAIDLWEERGKAQERAPGDVLEDLESKLSALLDMPAAGDAVVEVSAEESVIQSEVASDNK